MSVLTAIGMMSSVAARAQQQTAPPAVDATTAEVTPGADGSDTAAPPPELPEDLRLVEARAQFTAGQAAFDADAWEPALAAFERAFALTGSSELLYNIAIASERLGLLAQAVERYEAYIRALPDASDRAAVDSRLRTLRAQLALQRSAEHAASQREREQHARERTAATTRVRVDARGGGLLAKWWFWAAVGAVAAGATVGTVLLLDGGGPEPIAGSNGVVLTALTVGP